MNLRNNKIKSIPKEIKNCIKISYLNLGENKISFIPNEIKDLQSLVFFAIDHNQIEELPNKMGKDLATLYVSSNKIKKLPDLSHLKNLKKLYLTSNQIVSLPPSIGNLPNLKVLDVRDNQIKALPESIGNLQNLEDLDVSKNDIQEIPNTVIKLTKLPFFDYTKNPLKKPPIQARGLPWFKAWLKNRITDDLSESDKASYLTIANEILSNVWTEIRHFEPRLLPKTPHFIDFKERFLDIEYDFFTYERAQFWLRDPSIIRDFGRVEVLNLENKELSYIPLLIGLLTSTLQLLVV